MNDALKKVFFALLAVLMLGVGACGYAGIASHNGRLYIAKNCFMGACRAVLVCTESGDKLVCKTAGNP